MAENCLERMQRIDGKRKIADFIVKQKQDYHFKVQYATIRAREFERECEARGLNFHVSVGGLDSITLLLRPIFYDLQLPWLIVTDLPDIMT